MHAAGCLPALKKLSLACNLDRATAVAVATSCPALETLVIEDGCKVIDKDTGLGWQYPAAFPHLHSLTWSPPDAYPGVVFPFGSCMDTVQGRRLQNFHLLGKGMHENVNDEGVGMFMTRLASAAALPAVVQLGGWCEGKRDLLLLLSGGPAAVAPLRELSMDMEDLTANILAPLTRLPGLTRLTLTVQIAAAWPNEFPAFPCLQELTLWTCPFDVPTRPLAEWGAAWVRALAASEARHSLHTIELLGYGVQPAVADGAVVAEARKLKALRRLTLGPAVWCLAGGRVTGRWEEARGQD